MLGSVPGLAAVIALYGEFADPQGLKALSGDLQGVVPPSFVQMLSQQIGRLAGQQGGGLEATPESLGWFALMIWSANRGMTGLVDALNVIYDRVEERAFFERLATTLIMTITAILFMVLAIAGVLVLPVVIATLPVESNVSWVLRLGRWPTLLLLAAIATALLLRFGPSRKETGWPSVLLGSTIGAALWIGGSVLFSWYARNLASFSAIYGSLGTVMALLIWLWLSALAVLIGAECDAAYAFVNRSKERFPGEDTHQQEYQEYGYRNEK